MHTYVDTYIHIMYVQIALILKHNYVTMSQKIYENKVHNRNESVLVYDVHI